MKMPPGMPMRPLKIHPVKVALPVAPAHIIAGRIPNVAPAPGPTDDEATADIIKKLGTRLASRNK